MAEPRRTVPSPTSFALASSTISNSTRRLPATILRATEQFFFLASQSDRIKGTSAPQPGPFAGDRPGPEVGYGRCPVRVFGVELGKLALGLRLYPIAPAPDLVCQPSAMPRDILEDDLVEKDCDRVQVRIEGVSAHPERLQRNRSPSGKRIDDQGPGARKPAEGLVGRLGEGAGGLEISRIGRAVPVGELGDEVEERLSDLEGVIVVEVDLSKGVPEPLHRFRRIFEEPGRARWVAGVWPEGSADDGAAGSQWPTRPPGVERRDVNVPDRLLAPGVGADPLYREGYFDQALGIVHSWSEFIPN